MSKNGFSTVCIQATCGLQLASPHALGRPNAKLNTIGACLSTVGLLDPYSMIISPHQASFAGT